jgi:hypothetical protein
MIISVIIKLEIYIIISVEFLKTSKYFFLKIQIMTLKLVSDFFITSAFLISVGSLIRH